MADSKYHWTGEDPAYVGDTGAGLPYPTMDSPPNAPEQLEKLARSVAGDDVWIDADNDDLSRIPRTGHPLRFFGEGRPDHTGWQGTNAPYPHYVDLEHAPIGSTFTCTSENEDVYGAKQWQHLIYGGVPFWHCTQGQIGYSCPTVPGWSVARTPYTLQLYFSINGVGAYEELPAFKTGTHWGLGTNQMNSFWGNHPSPGRIGHVRILSNGRTERAEGNTDRPQQILHNAPMFLTRQWISGPAWDGAKRLTKDDYRRQYLVDTIADIEEQGETHPDHELLQQLRDELAELEGQNNG